jgi:hypothetical protein
MHVHRALPLAAILAALAGLAMAPPAAAQILQGTVIDAETGSPLAGARIDVRAERGRYSAQSQSGADGAFAMYVPEAGGYRIQASQDGYTRMEAVSVAVGENEAVVLTLRLSRTVIGLEPLTVTARRPDARHDNSLAGALARHAVLPKAGNRRVIGASDQEMRSATRLDELLRHWLPRARPCRIMWVNGHLVLQVPQIDAWLETTAYNVALFEFYRDYVDAPQGLRALPPYVRSPNQCSVIAVWTK